MAGQCRIGAAAQLPVTANQTPAPLGPVTNTVRGDAGLGKAHPGIDLRAPAVLALESPVLMLAAVAVFPAPMLWQLTMTRGPAQVAWPVTRLGPGGG